MPRKRETGRELHKSGHRRHENSDEELDDGTADVEVERKRLIRTENINVFVDSFGNGSFDAVFCQRVESGAADAVEHADFAAARR